MASGTARRHQGPFESAGRVLSVGLLAASLAGPAYGQAESQLASPSPVPAPFSRDCQIGSTAIVEESSLPNVAAALQNRKQIKILTIGASPLLGRRVLGGHGDPVSQLLRRAIKGLDVVMINRGISGELSAQAAQRIKNEVALTEPDLVLWQVGTNDALAYVPIDEFETTLVDTLSWLKEHKIDVVLVGLQYVDQMAVDDHYRAVRDALRKIAAKENVMIVRRYEAQQFLARAESGGGGLVPDEFQRNEAGYVCLSQYMARAITLGIFGKKVPSMPPAQGPAQVPAQAPAPTAPPPQQSDPPRN
jgi:acyl-CoA thioesterase-1